MPNGTQLWVAFRDGMKSGTKNYFAPLFALLYAIRVVLRTYLGHTPQTGDIYEPDTRNLLAKTFQRGKVSVLYVRNGMVHFAAIERSIFPEGSCHVTDFRFCFKRVE